MPVVGCPQCGARVRRPESGKPICPKCGYGKRAPGKDGPTSGIRSAYGDPRTGGKMDLPINISGRVTTPAGRPRDPVQIILLMLGTLGIYWFVWAFIAFKELSTLHRRDHPVLRYAFGFPIPPLMLLYIFMEVASLNEYRKQRNMPMDLTVGRFVLWFMIGVGVLFLGTFLYVVTLAGTSGGMVVAILSLLIFIALSSWMHLEVQKSINGIWKNAGVTG